ncbi:Phosphoadenosine phosphosulfate reductase [Nitrospira japonica]|uniref:Adenosine 5'-phosphosulfate reductase n=2 Tax=Nitrospira japonica TaxID=1325564 RepID=A0A1W1I484_9BACT|nr:phosphoadenylyl-sulfate reductase [Nitrospira japonica]SLM47633.1 Phosphoadenosine phosphosulfate reductase [Nitrospira japonica]
MTQVSPNDMEALQVWSDSFASKQPQEVLAAAIERYAPKIVLACSFGAEDVVLVDMVHRINPSVPLFYLDTDFLFPETHATRDRIAERYNLKPAQMLQVKSLLTPADQTARHGEALWAKDPDQCCKIRKVEPLNRILKTYDAWITGIRREQSPTRANAKMIEWDNIFGLVKVNPLAAWTWADVWTYIKIYEVPYNELHDRNYPSIGCTHCTKPVMPGEDPRSGRWQGREKTECGLHKKAS